MGLAAQRSTVRPRSRKLFEPFNLQRPLFIIGIHHFVVDLGYSSFYVSFQFAI